MRNKSWSTAACQLPFVTKSSQEFMSELQSFSRRNRRKSNLIPVLAGQRVDLRKLYNEVVSRGGHKRVTLTHAWSEIYNALGLPSGCVESGHGIRLIYQRYLESFERHQRLSLSDNYMEDTESPVIDADSQDTDITQKLLGMMENEQNVVEIPNHLRKPWNLSTCLNDRMEYMTLERSLSSDLPNEIHFALNTFLLMSFQADEFSLNRNTRLLPLLLRSIGISSLDSYPVVGIKYHLFWHFIVKNEFGQIFLHPDAFNKNVIQDYLSQRRVPSAVLREDLPNYENEESRVLLVATILRNLSATGGMNAIIIGRDPQALRFIFLCIYAEHSYLRHLGLETLSFLHFPVTGVLSTVVPILLRQLLLSYDRNDRIRGFQLLRHLCEVPVYFTSWFAMQPNSNSSILSTDRNFGLLLSLDYHISLAILTNLCVNDLYLVILALNSLYSLSSLGTTICDRLLTPHVLQPRFSNSKQMLNLLIDFLQFDGQSLSAEGLIRVCCTEPIRIESSATKEIQSTIRPPSRSYPTFTCTTTQSNLPVHASSQSTQAPVSAAINPHNYMLHTLIPQGSFSSDHSLPASSSIPSLKPGSITSSGTQQPVPIYRLHTPQSFLQPNHPGQNLMKHENSTDKVSVVSSVPINVATHSSAHKPNHAEQWLKRNCVSSHGSTLKQSQLYQCYLMSLDNRCDLNATSLEDFHAILRTVFPTAELQALPGDAQLYYKNICLTKVTFNGDHAPNGDSQSVDSGATSITNNESSADFCRSQSNDLPNSSVAFKIARSLPNGHPANPTLQNGRPVINGFNKDSVYIINGQMPVAQKSHSFGSSDLPKTCPNVTRAGLTHCGNFGNLVPGERNLVLVPVFTAVALRPAFPHMVPTSLPYDGITPPNFAVQHSTLAQDTTDLNSNQIPVTSKRIDECAQSEIPRKAVTCCLWDQCEKNFTDSISLLSHLQEVHFASQSTVTCKWRNCQTKVLFTTQTILDHISSVHLELNSSVNGGHEKMGMCSLSDLLQAGGLEPPDSIDLESLLNLKSDSVANPSLARNISCQSITSEQCEDNPPMTKQNTCQFPSLNSYKSVWSPPLELSDACKRALYTTPRVSSPPGKITEVPITKHIRVTAALILKNFLFYSSHAREHVRIRESLLCDLAFSTMDSSPVIFDCLCLLRQGDPPSHQFNS